MSNKKTKTKKKNAKKGTEEFLYELSGGLLVACEALINCKKCKGQGFTLGGDVEVDLIDNKIQFVTNPIKCECRQSVEQIVKVLCNETKTKKKPNKKSKAKSNK